MMGLMSVWHESLKATVISECNLKVLYIRFVPFARLADASTPYYTYLRIFEYLHVSLYDDEHASRISRCIHHLADHLL